MLLSTLQAISGSFVGSVWLHLLFESSTVLDGVARVTVHVHGEVCWATRTAHVALTQYLMSIGCASSINRSPPLLALKPILCNKIMLEALGNIKIGSRAWIKLFLPHLISLNIRIKWNFLLVRH